MREISRFHRHSGSFVVNCFSFNISFSLTNFENEKVSNCADLAWKSLYVPKIINFPDLLSLKIFIKSIQGFSHSSINMHSNKTLYFYWMYWICHIWSITDRRNHYDIVLYLVHLMGILYNFRFHSTNIKFYIFWFLSKEPVNKYSKMK